MDRCVRRADLCQRQSISIHVHDGGRPDARSLAVPAATATRSAMKPPTVFLGEMTTVEVDAFLKQNHTVIIPVGATEKHGPHGPLLTDVLISQEVARRAAPRVNAVVAPPVNYALSYPHVGFTGLVCLRIPTFMSMIEDLAAAFG